MWYAGPLTPRGGGLTRPSRSRARAVALDPVSPASYSNRGMIFLSRRRYKTKRSEPASRRSNSTPLAWNALWWQLARQRHVSLMDFAVIYAGLGDADSTFSWLEKAYQSRTTRVSGTEVDVLRRPAFVA